MSAHEASAMPDSEEFLLHVAENLVPSQQLHKINNVDEMLDKHGQERRQAEHPVGRTHIRDAISSAYAHHYPMETGIIFLHITLAGDSTNYIMCHCFGTLLTVFHHLWHRMLFAFRYIIHVVACNEHTVIIDRTQIPVQLYAASFSRIQFLSRFRRNVGSFYAGCPYHCTCCFTGQLVISAEFDEVRANVCHTCIQ